MARARRVGVVFAGLIAVGALSCRRKPPPVADDPELSPNGVASLELGGAGLPPTVPSATSQLGGVRCREVVPGAVYTVGEVGHVPSEEEDEPSLPFAVELGNASPWRGGFAVAGLRGKDGGTTAFLALVGADAGSGQLVDLGPTHGNVGAPRVAAWGSKVVVVVPDGDAAGQRLRLARLEMPGGPPSVSFGAEISEGRDDSAEFDLALGEKRGVLAWDEWDAKAERGVIRLASFDPDQLGQLSTLPPIAPAVADVEAPQLSPRPGGFWLTFVAHERDGSGAGAGPKAGKNGQPAKEETDEELGRSVVDLGRRRLQVVPLDDNGVPQGEPIAASAGQMHVLVSDAVTLPDGAALLAWRNDDTSPGVEGGEVVLARVGRDGSVVRHLLDGQELGAGVPSLVAPAMAAAGIAPKPPGAPEWMAWLSLTGVSDRTALGAISKEGRSLEPIRPEPWVRNAEPLAVRDGQILMARPKGLSMELAVARCVPAAPQVPPELPAQAAPSVPR